MPFDGEFKFKWLPDGRNMELLNTLTYITKNEEVITVPKGECTDGASIPRLLWTFNGGPFEGKYRYAAVVHDYLCRLGYEKHTPLFTWQRTHQIFYEAMLESGVGKTEALSKYLAVRLFGPRW